MRHFSIILLLAASALQLVAGQREYTARDHVTLDMPSSPVVSPDGKYIAFTVRKADLEKSKWITQIHLLTVADKSVRQITFSPQSCTSPAWSPNGSWLTFVSSREFLDSALSKHSGSAQLFALPLNGGEAVPLTTLENGVDEYAWSPDGGIIAILSGEELSAEKQAEAEKNTKLKMDWTSSLDPKHGKDLRLLTMATKHLKKVKTIDRGASGISWSPDGKTILYQSNYTADYNDEQKYDLWTVDLAGHQTQLTKTAGPETRGRYSPDGKSIAFITQTVPDIEFAKTELSIMDATGGNVRSVTKSLPYSVTQFCWTPDTKSIIAVVNEKTSALLYSIDPATGAAKKLADGLFVLGDLTLSSAGIPVVSMETSTTLREVAVIKKGKPEALTTFSHQIASFQFGQQEVISVKSRDGKFDIEAVLVKPVGYVEGKKYPLLLAYHGGPYGEFDNKLYQSYPVQMLAQKGVMVVLPNVRGGSGYTDEFSQSNRYDLGGGDFRDAMDVVDYLISRGMADSSQMGVTGGSYGGYMTNWTISQTTRFKAAISMYGIFSWFTDWSNSWQPAFEQMYFGYNYWEKPLDQNSLWISRAPQTYVRNIGTPTLILQGTEDQYTNISNSREMYQALKELGCTVEFVVYPRAEHGLRTEPNQYINVLERSVAWFQKYAMNK